MEEQIKLMNEYTTDDFKDLYDEVVKEASEYDVEDDIMHKWIMRTLSEQKLYYKTELTKEQIRQLAKQQMERSQAWKMHAKNEYGITVTDEEIDEYIENGPDKSENPQRLAFAEALGMTLKEYNHEFDRDLYENQVLMHKLLPKLEEKYDIEEQDILMEKYSEESIKDLEEKFTFVQEDESNDM